MKRLIDTHFITAFVHVTTEEVQGRVSVRQGRLAGVHIRAGVLRTLVETEGRAWLIIIIRQRRIALEFGWPPPRHRVAGTLGHRGQP